MSLYPSLEDMKVDQIAQAQLRSFQHWQSQQNGQLNNPISAPPYPPVPNQNGTAGALQQPVAASSHYPSLHEYMGLELTEAVIAANMPEYLPVAAQQTSIVSSGGSASGMIAPLSGQTPGLQRSWVTHGVREVVLCKDGKGKIGLRVRDVSKGIFVCLVQNGSPAALSGLRFGDQILQINGQNVAGLSDDKVHNIFRNADKNNIVVAVRDRPFERTVTMHKDSSGHVGFQFKNGSIASIVKDSSAARNGLLTGHHLLEVNGQNVIGMNDKDITKIIDNGGPTITITIMPDFVYDHIIKHMASGLKKTMDHSVPEV